MRALYLSLLFIFTGGLKAQNLVPNAGFENFTTCPNSLTQIDYAFPWDRPAGHGGTSDYFNACSNSLANTYVPTNIFGFQYPSSGNGYAGLITYLSINGLPSATAWYREYISAPLVSPLVAGVTYAVSFKVNTANLDSRCASDAIQLFLSVGAPTVLTGVMQIPVNTPLIANPAGNVITDTTNWTLISGNYTATGGESHVTIGNFLSDVQTTLQCAPSLTPPFATYFFIDDVAVIEQTFQVVGADTICSGDSVLLQAFNASGIWWSTATLPNDTIGTGNNLMVAPTVTTTYICNSGSGTDSHTVFVFQPPVVFLGNDTTLCLDTFQISAGITGVQYFWSNNDSVQTITVNQSGTYWVNVTDSAGCSSSDTIDITLISKPVADLGPDTNLCDSIYMIAAGNPAYSYTWSNGSTSPVITLTQSDTVWVSIDNNGCIASDTVIVNLFSNPLVNLGPDTTLCGDSIVLDAGNPGLSYNWSASQTTQQVTVSQSGMYAVAVTDNNGCTGTDTINVQIFQIPVAAAGPDTTLCANSYQLEAGSSGFSYLWSTGDSTYTISVNQSGTYFVLIDNNGCVSIDSVQVTLLPVPVVDLGPDTFFCTGDLLLDAGNPGANFLWSTGGTGQTELISVTGSYSVTATLGNCSDMDSIQVTIGPQPVVDLGPDTVLCAASFSLDAGNPGAVYLWQDNSNAQTLTTTQSGLYYVTAAYGPCQASDTINVTLYEPVDEVNLGRDTIVCGGPVILTAGGTGNTFIWSTGDTTRQISAGISGTFWVEVSNGICSDADTILLTIYDQPSIDLGPSRLICKDEQFNLNAYYPGATYLWSTGASQAIYTINAPGIYWVKASIGPCSDTDSISIIAATPPDIMQHGSLCDQGQVTLHAGEVRGDVLWSNGERRNPVYVNAPGTYVIEVLEEHCSMTDTVEVTGMVSDQLYLPNAFRPNSDGLNDVFPGTVEEAQDYLLVIYDRWGEQIFQSSDPSLNWDGTWQGRDAPNGLYVYTVHYKSVCSGEPVVQAGHLSLIR